jgi:hypothetical protein
MGVAKNPFILQKISLLPPVCDNRTRLQESGTIFFPLGPTDERYSKLKSGSEIFLPITRWITSFPLFTIHQSQP